MGYPTSCTIAEQVKRFQMFKTFTLCWLHILNCFQIFPLMQWLFVYKGFHFNKKKLILPLL